MNGLFVHSVGNVMSSQLTNSRTMVFQRGRAQPPTRTSLNGDIMISWKMMLGE